MNIDLKSIFGKFAGQAITLDTNNRIDYNDPVIQEIKKTAEENGLLSRFFLPGDMGTMDMNPNRLNIQIEEDYDKNFKPVWKIADKFTIG